MCFNFFLKSTVQFLACDFRGSNPGPLDTGARDLLTEVKVQRFPEQSQFVETIQSVY